MKTNKKPLTQEDKKMIRSEKRMGYVFATLILTAGAFVSMVLALLKPNDTSLLVLTIAITVALSLLILYLVNRKHNLDIRVGYKLLKQALLTKKEKIVSYEAGSGKLYIPILAEIAPKLWGQKMRPSDKYYFIVEGEKYEVDETTYKNTEPNDEVEMNYTSVGNNFLGISVSE
ncbi:MAG TPA: hypothetical protein VJ937_06810 [Salinivirga sp.]|uniref:hypothetical protein n=1 Tax=Salinivirga sp. TaxID=1970192 RepID=UPI002B47BD7E|nr:hypothetical protein [Salinivirga sp.]HKK59170.1 hypothetical protein [Salinivirga sp.]